LNISDIGVKAQMGNIKVIQAFDGDLLTRHLSEKPKISRGQVVADIENDILKICVINRYQPSDPVVGFIKGFGLKKGALASTVAHDSHNLICVGANDADMITAINAISESGGGIAVADGEKCEMLPLPVAGLMSDADAFLVAAEYENINKKAVALGSNLHAPFMTLSFMALLVIPELKISDKGLFDGTKFDFVSLFDSH
jgi:adenine deaminase